MAKKRDEVYKLVEELRDFLQGETSFCAHTEFFFLIARLPPR